MAIQQKRPQTAVKYNIVKHDAPFRPSNPNKSVKYESICLHFKLFKISLNKQGYNGTIDKFPEYKPDPLKPLVRVDKPKDKEPFK